MTASQNDRIRSILADGNWHTAAELYRRVPSVLHSRVSQMRKQGYVIEHRGGGAGAENHEYRLVVPERVAA